MSLRDDVFADPAPGVVLAFELQAAGFSLRITERLTLGVAPADRLTPELVRRIESVKADLTTVTACCDDVVLDFVVRFRRALKADQPLVITPGLPYVLGRCYSCAADLEGRRIGCCWRCGIARRLACRAPIAPSLFFDLTSETNQGAAAAWRIDGIQK